MLRRNAIYTSKTWRKRDRSVEALQEPAAFDAQTASCYVLKPHMLEPLIEIARMSIEMFRAGEPYSMAAYDQVWKNLQRKHVFVVPSKRAAQERASYSDIEEVVVDYKA
jgi:hypothetical protein